MRAVLGMVVALWSTSALADWQYTRWGMTIDEVIVASEGQAEPYENGKKNTETSAVELTAPYQGAGLKFFTYFSFDTKSNGLVYVSLELADPSLCYELIGKLQSTYGTGTRPVETGLMDIYKWMDPKRGNIVSLTRFATSSSRDLPSVTTHCGLTYQPYLEPGAKGGL